MSNLELSTLTDCLEVCCSIHSKQQTEMMNNFYFQALGDLDDGLVTVAFGVVIDERYFPTPARIRELVTGITPNTDWQTIMAVASGSQKSGTISGISAIALTTATATNSIIAALRKISFCDDHYNLREIRTDWEKLASTPRLGTALPPADVTITLVTQTADNNFEYPTDDDYSVRTASMIRCIREKGYMSPAWLPIIDKFPVAKKREILNLISSCKI